MTDLSRLASRYIAESVKAQQSVDPEILAEAVQLLIATRGAGNTVFITGNGGSAATASHAAVDFLKSSSVKHGKPTLAVSIPDQVPVTTAISNDSDYEFAFTEQIGWFGKSGDVLLAISASGNSPNILSAAKAASASNMPVIALCGFGGGKLSEMADISIAVDSSEYGPVEDAHMMIIHLFTRLLQDIEPTV
jgi:D-sedoheptulose 7-phosphate isomerase